MAKSSTFITGLDIGTSSVKIVVAQKRTQEDVLEVLYSGQKAARGIRRGIVVDIESVARCIQEVIKSAELSLGQKLSGVYITIGGGHIFCTPSHGLVSVSRADGNISEEDVSRVLQAARTISLSSNKEIVDVYPREFIVDGEGGVKDAIGMHGVRLEAEVLIVAGFTPYLKNSDQAILRSNLEILNRAPSAIASGFSALTDQQKELGVALLDIGAGTSSLAIYDEGDLIHLAILPIGSSNITNDLAIGLKTDILTAEKLKIEKGTCIFKGADKKIKLEDENGKTVSAVFSQRLVSRIISERVIEVFNLANAELKKIGRDKKLPAGIVLVGGGVKLAQIEELAKKEFQLTASIGVPQKLANIEYDPALTAAAGLVLQAWQDNEDETSEPSRLSMIGANGIDKVKKFFKNFIP